MGNIVDRRVPGPPTPAETLTYTAEGCLRGIVRGASTDEVLYYDALGSLAYRRSGGIDPPWPTSNERRLRGR